MSAMAAFMAGMREEEQRAEERAFREAQLALEERRVGAVEDRLAFDVDEADRQAEFRTTQLDFEQQRIDLTGESLGLQREEFDFRRSEAERARQEAEARFTRRAAGAREGLVQRFQYPRSMADRLDDEAAVQMFESLDAERRELLRGRAQVQSAAMGQLGVLLDVTRQERQDAFTEFQSEQDQFENFLTEGITQIPEHLLAQHGLPTDRAQLLQTMTDAEVRNSVGMQLYQLANPQAAQRFQVSQERLQRMSGQRDNMVQQINDMLGTPTMIEGMIGGFSPEEVMGTTGTFETLSTAKQAEEIAHWSMRAARSPVDFARQLPELRDRGFPVQAVFQQLGITEQEFTQQIEESLEMARRIGAQDPVGAVEGSLGVPPQMPARPLPPLGGATRPDHQAREEMQRELREIASDVSAPPGRGTGATQRGSVSMERFLPAARRAMGAGAISLSDVLEMLPAHQRDFAEDRLPGRVSR